MLTSISLENFKGIRDRMTIPLKSITLLFGANSSGKSTIVQAIHYVREILLRNNLNPDRTTTGGSAIDLGGFLNLLNNRDAQRTMKLKLEFDYDVFSVNYTDNDSNVLTKDEEHDQDFFVSEIENAAVELSIRWSPVLQSPMIIGYETELNGVAAARLLTTLDKAEYRFEYNEDHPLLHQEEEMDGEAEEEQKENAVYWKEVPVSNLRPGLPYWGERITPDAGRGYYHRYARNPKSFSVILTQMLTGPGEILRKFLSEFRYLGPLRKTPPRNWQVVLTRREEDWADGIAAWNEIYHSRQEKIDEISSWMADKNRLNTGYSVRLKRFREIPVDSPLLNELLIALKNDTFFENFDADYFEQERDRHEIKQRLVIVEDETNLELAPHDIGVGVSQILPVVVASLASRRGLLAVEQPELHLHPAIQAKLGDLFIESALGTPKNLLLLETHSEHLILRILRRIRETTDGELEPGILPVQADDVQVLYTKATGDGTKLYSLPITPGGDFAVQWPDGFFDERAEELF